MIKYEIMGKSVIFIIFLFLLWVFGGFLPNSGYDGYGASQGQNFTAKLLDSFPNDIVSRLELEAKAAFVFDLKNNSELFAKNVEAQLPLASLAKLMTALAAVENLDSGAVISISKEALEQEGDSGLFLNERWSLKDLIDIMLVNSSNDAAFAVSEAALLSETARPFQEIAPTKSQNDKILALMNSKARELEMRQTFFLNATGLDLNNEISGAYGSAKDIVILLKYILENHPDILSATNQESLKLVSFDGQPHIFQNTNQSLNKISGFVAGKTGFTDLAAGNLAVVFDAGFNHPIAAVVLGSSFDGRFKDMERLLEATYKNFEYSRSQ